MKETDKQEYKELFQLLMKFYHVFYEILKTGTPMEKAFALRSFDSVNQQIREKIGEYEELHQIHFADMEPVISSDKEILGEEALEMKEDLMEIKRKTEPLIEEVNEGFSKGKGRKRRGRRIKKNLEAKG